MKKQVFIDLLTGQSISEDEIAMPEGITVEMHETISSHDPPSQVWFQPFPIIQLIHSRAQNRAHWYSSIIEYKIRALYLNKTHYGRWTILDDGIKNHCIGC